MRPYSESKAFIGEAGVLVRIPIEAGYYEDWYHGPYFSVTYRYIDKDEDTVSVMAGWSFDSWFDFDD
jgi:hypothetical protein